MIRIQHLTKRYKKYTAPYNSLKSFILHYKQYRQEMARVEELCVVDDLSMEIGSGEIVCVVGRNGAGKSTLAKLISGTVEPTSGSVQVDGTIIPFLELGVAFNSELNGFDNVRMNGTLLRMRRKQIEEQMEDIFRYAEIEDFAATPLKYYSSGMLMRLAFSIGIHADGDIYIFDEILAVGDANFQKKCFAAFEDLIRQGKTIILITHDLGLVSRYATRVLLLNQGLYRDIRDAAFIKLIKERTINELYAEQFG